MYGSHHNIHNKFHSMEDISRAIRAGPMICFDGELDLDKLMKADFSPLERGDCSIRYNEIFRWAWESWRLAVGRKVGTIYPAAIKVMNQGAKHNGKYLILNLFYLLQTYVRIKDTKILVPFGEKKSKL